MKRAFLFAWPFLMTLSAVFFVTFVIFPAVITDSSLHFLRNIENPGLRFSWTMDVFITTFNVSDTVGRWLAGQPYGLIGDKGVFIISYARIVFIVTSFLVDYNQGSDWLVGDSGDWFKLLNMALFAFTNGYCSTACAIKSPSKAPEDSKETVGTFVGVFITSGIVVGSLIALATASLVHGNPK